MRPLLCLVVVTAACSTTPAATDASVTDTAVTDAPSDASAITDADVATDATEAAVRVERGPARVALDGDPNGLWWDSADRTLYIADNANNRVLAWRDGASTSVFVELPPGPPTGPGLGQLVRTSDGTIIVPRFGDGTAGDVVYASRDGTVGRISNLDVTRRRIGLTVASDGTLYDGWFIRGSSGRVGTVSTLTLAGTEVDALTGLTKPVGVLAVGAHLFVSDQDRNEVLVVDRASPTTSMRRFAMVTGPDLLCAGPAGSLFSGSTSGVVYRIASDGSVSTFDTGYQSTRGVAYDAENRRLFVADHDTNAADGITHQIRIVPVDS